MAVEPKQKIIQDKCSNPYGFSFLESDDDDVPEEPKKKTPIFASRKRKAPIESSDQSTIPTEGNQLHIMLERLRTPLKNQESTIFIIMSISALFLSEANKSWSRIFQDFIRYL